MECKSNEFIRDTNCNIIRIFVKTKNIHLLLYELRVGKRCFLPRKTMSYTTELN